MNILLAITFVYGVIRLLTYTKLFNTNLTGLTQSIIGRNEKYVIGSILIVLDNIFFYFSLCFQAYYWLFN